MTKVKVLYKFPHGGGYVTREGTYKTVATQNPNTGKMTGRKEVRGYGDKTGIMRVKKPFILVKKSPNARGHVRSIRQQFGAGQIAGRTPN
jgi:hypothetical protein